ncbi:hypothetical protein C2G38_1137485 [Gigaspora rosea]|uniref:Uncharacterized protein n=1 Tax=Gigaspora rosea TaxID=44941 RepID=A0A397VEX0_9GLOM|nr:hypothetical protein C2G38_1137485 [Gigaspora rosea]
MKIPDTNDSFPNEKDSDKPSNEDINEKDKEADEINNQADEIIEQVFKIITKATPSIIKAILEDGNLCNEPDKISSDVQSKIDEKIFEILRKISIKISKKSSDTCYVDNILSAKISTEIQFTLKSKEARLTTKINLLKEIKSFEIKRIIFAEIHIETAIILLRELFDILLEKFGDQLQIKLSGAIIENITEMKEEENCTKKLNRNMINLCNKMFKIKEKTEENVPKEIKKVSEKTDEIVNFKNIEIPYEKENVSSKIIKKAEEMSIDISKKIKEEISKYIQEKIEEYFYKILNEVYYDIKMDEMDDNPVTYNEGQASSKKIQDDDETDEPGQETSNKGHTSSEKIQNDQSYDLKIDEMDDEPVTSNEGNEGQAPSEKIQDDDKTDKLGQETANKFSEQIQNNQSIIIYKIDKIRNLFSKTMKDKIGIISEDKNNLTKSLKDNLTKSLKDNLTESLKEILIKEDSKDLDMEHIIFIICAILDSESLLFIDNISGDYTKKIKSHVKKNKPIFGNIKDHIEDYVKAFNIIRVLVEFICKSIPLLIIMVIYTSEIVIIGYMPLIALITSCLKFLSCFVILCYHFYHSKNSIKQFLELFYKQ